MPMITLSHTHERAYQCELTRAQAWAFGTGTWAGTLA